MRYRNGPTLVVILAVIVPVILFGCASKPKPRVPLAVQPAVPQELAAINTLGIQEYQARQFGQARQHFAQVVAGAPTSAEAHYNLGLTLYAMGESEQAHEQFIEAANLAPGDKVIWDSPALHAYGSPEPNIQKQAKDPNYSNQRPSFGGGPRR